VAACPRLTELTVIYPHPYGAPVTVETARSATSGLVDACKALPDFDTLQILHFLPDTFPPRRVVGWDEVNSPFSTERWKRMLSEEVKGVKDWVMGCLEAKTGSQEGDGKKRTVLRVIGLNSDLILPRLRSGALRKFHLGPVKVEEYEV